MKTGEMIIRHRDKADFTIDIKNNKTRKVKTLSVYTYNGCTESQLKEMIEQCLTRVKEKRKDYLPTTKK